MVQISLKDIVMVTGLPALRKQEVAFFPVLNHNFPYHFLTKNCNRIPTGIILLICDSIAYLAIKRVLRNRKRF